MRESTGGDSRSRGPKSTMQASSSDNPGPLRVALTGATGYVGGRLAQRLLASGHSLHCLVRSEEKLAARSWSHHDDVTAGTLDMLDVDHMADEMAGCDVAYYLVHSMQSTRDYAEHDRRLATNFAEAAHRAGIQRIIYLGGLGEMETDLSLHLQSRQEVERCLESTPVPVTTFRAAMIIGSGSASFEILRYLVERLPVMVTPKWVKTESQPISILDVLYYLEKGL